MAYDAIEMSDVSPCGDFRYDSAERGMLSGLRHNNIADDFSGAVVGPAHHGGSRFIAGRFYA